MSLLLILGCSVFVSSLAIRLVEPIVPTLAQDLATTEANISILVSAYAAPYALVQLILGPVSDQVGKARVIVICLFMLTLATAMAATAESIEMIFVARVLGGLAGGGIVPIAIALVGDLVPVAQRQTALSKIMVGMLCAGLVGTAGTGLLATLIGWRGVFVAAAAFSAIVAVIALTAFRNHSSSRARRDVRIGLGNLFQGYAQTFTNPLAYVCFGAVFVEGALVIGLLPFIATMLAARDAGGVAEAGIVLAGISIGGLLYTRFGERLTIRIGGTANLIRFGALLVALGFFGVAGQMSWPLEMAAFVVLGIGYYSIHISLQTLATELAPDFRGAAVALFAFCYFIGMAVGPIFYAGAFYIAPPAPVISICGLIASILALALATVFKSRS